MFFDPLYLLMVLVPGLLLAGIAAVIVKSRFRHFSQVPIRSGMSGAETAREILRRNGLNGIPVELHQGFLSDHYDPARRIVRLSPAVYQGRSVSAVAVAAHETGHALQHAKAYAPLALRSASVPLASLGSNLSYLMILIGSASAALGGLAVAGVALFAFVVLFQLVTVPVEFNASTRAKAQLLQLGLVTPNEEADVSKVLSAAAMTYVAALVVSLITLLYFLLRLGLLGGSRNG
jgi:uncharacterized protein